MAGGHSLVVYPFVAYAELCNSHTFDRVRNLLRKREQLAINDSSGGGSEVMRFARISTSAKCKFPLRAIKALAQWVARRARLPHM